MGDLTEALISPWVEACLNCTG